MVCVTLGKLSSSLFLSPSSATLDQHFSECGLWTVRQGPLRSQHCPRPAELEIAVGGAPTASHCWE